MEDLTGHRFGRLTVLGLGEPVRYRADHPTKPGQIKRWKWRCRCDCGKEVSVDASNLKHCTFSCGCHRRESCGNLFRTHGDSGTPEYRIWCGMHKRCYNPNWKQYADYGGRGIKVCDRWRKSYANFLADIGRRPSPNHSLDRIDHDGDYSPENCRWATAVEQARNRRMARMLTYGGETMCLSAWAERYSLRAQTLGRRLRAGWDAERALTTPVEQQLSA
jgi:hypothetical protein